MFFDSIFDGVQTLTYWRFWAVALGAGIVGIAPMLLVVLASLRSEVGGNVFGCMISPLMFIWSPLVLTYAILLLFPLMIARSNVIPFDLLMQFSLWDIAKITIVGLIAFIAVGILPLIGAHPSIPMFAQGATILGMLMYMVSSGQAIIWPGILMVIGLTLTGLIVSVVTFFALVMPLVAVSANRGENWSALLAPPLSLVPALVPVCMYAGWLRQVNGL